MKLKNCNTVRLENCRRFWGFSMLVFIDSRKGIKIQIFNICRSEERVQIDFLQRNHHPSQPNGVYEETDKVRTNSSFIKMRLQIFTAKTRNDSTSYRGECECAVYAYMFSQSEHGWPEFPWAFHSIVMTRQDKTRFQKVLRFRSYVVCVAVNDVKGAPKGGGGGFVA